MSQLSLSYFGTPRIEINGTPVEVTRRKAVALLAYLAVTGQGHSRETLATLLWPEADQTRARAALRSALWSLNKTALQDWLVIEPERVALSPPAPPVDAGSGADHTVTVDTANFEALLDVAQRHVEGSDSEKRLDALNQAVALYRNDFLAGFTLPDAPEFDDWHFFKANDLRRKLAWTLETLVSLRREQDNLESAIVDARRYVTLDPLHEPAHRLLMELYAEAGQQSAALRQYEICRERLDAELGVSLSDETDALFESIRSGVWQKEPKAVRTTTTGASVNPADSQAPSAAGPNNLPPEPTPLIGREHDLARLAAYLDEKTTRLLTVVGPGGIGKTRLALAAAAEQVNGPGFDDGIYFVSLAPLAEEEAMVPAIAQVVGSPFQDDGRSPRQQLLDFLNRKSLLLLLDNVEHLLSGRSSDGGALVAAILQQAPHVKILTTSRERLNLYEEQRYPLSGLAVADGGRDETDPSYAAGLLFLQSVRRRLPDYEMTPEDAPHLADLCRLVEGMPLALELAASEMELLSLGEITDGIRENLDLLATDVRNVPARHRSMQAVFDSSWQTLSETEQQTYAQLSICRGGFTQEAAEAITALSGRDARQILRGLVYKSLLRYDSVHKRYEVHELLRQYAAEQLAIVVEDRREDHNADRGENGEDTERHRHATYYCAYLHEREADLKGQRQQKAMAEIETDSENALVAWQWAAEHALPPQLEQALIPLSFLYQWRGRLQEAEGNCRLAAEKLAATLFNGQGNKKEISKEKNQDAAWSPEMIDRARVLARVLTWEGSFNLALGQYDDARRCFQDAQEIFETPGFEEERTSSAYAFLLLQLSNLTGRDDFGGDSVALCEQSLAVYTAAGDEWGRAEALDGLSQSEMNLGRHAKARALREECLAIRQRLGDQRGIARSYNLLGLQVLHVGEIERSEVYLRQSLSLYREMNNPADLIPPLAVLGINLLFAGKFEECIATFEECWTIHRNLGLPKEPFVANVTMARAKINLGRYDEARQQSLTDLANYRSISSPWHIAFALYNLGRINLVEGTVEQAHQQLLESSELLQQMNEKSLLPDVLFCLAYAHRALGDREQAMQTMAQALQLVIETGPLNPMRFELPGMALLLADGGETDRAVEFYAAATQSPYISNSRWFEDFSGRQMVDLGATLPQRVLDAAQERGRERDLWQTANDLLVELSKANSEA